MSADAIDLVLLKALQDDGQANNKDLAALAGLSPSATLERVRRLFREGYIQRVTAILQPTRLDLGLLAFVFVDIAHVRSREKVIAVLEEIPHVIEIHTVTGESFFLLKIRSSGTMQLNDIVTRIASLPGVRGTRTLIALETFKETHELPIAGR